MDDGIDTKSLENQFTQIVNTIGKQIEAKVKLSEQLLKEAISLSEAHGIPFYSGISSLSQPYVPTTFAEKYSGLDPSVVENLTSVTEYDLNQGSYGWQISQVCY